MYIFYTDKIRNIMSFTPTFYTNQILIGGHILTGRLDIATRYSAII